MHLHLFNFLYRVRDLRPRWSARRRAGFSCATLYIPYILMELLNKYLMLDMYMLNFWWKFDTDIYA
jgi:hypothetical protein